jgi:Acyl carrier protein
VREDELKARVRQVVGDTLNVDPETVDDHSSPQTIAEWTSFNHLTLMAAAEEAFGMTLSMEEMNSVKSVGDLTDLVRRHAG